MCYLSGRNQSGALIGRDAEIASLPLVATGSTLSQITLNCASLASGDTALDDELSELKGRKILRLSKRQFYSVHMWF